MANTNSVGNTLTGVTGSGTFVGATSPTLIAPALGTPASGTLTNCTGYPGTYTGTTILFASAIAYTTNVSKTLTSITLPAGDWIIYGNFFGNCNTATLTFAQAGISATTNTLPDSALCANVNLPSGTSQSAGLVVPCIRVTPGTLTTYFLIGYLLAPTGTLTGCGSLFARGTGV